MIREKLAESKVGGIVVAIVLCLIAGALLTIELWPSQQRVDLSVNFYSDDDGKTYYTDSVYNFPPYEHNGKTAYRAFVYQSDHGKFVGFLLRYRPDARKKLQDTYNKAKASGASNIQQQVLQAMADVRFNTETKLPGQNNWVPMGNAFPRFKSPDGSLPYLVNP